MSRTTRSPISRRARSSAATSTSGPLIVFGSRPSPKPTPSFWNEPTTNASAGRPSARARPRRALAGRPSGKRSSSMPIGMRWTRDGSTPGRDDDLLHLAVRHLHAREPSGVAAERLVRARRTRGSPASRDGRGSTRARAGGTSPSRAGRAPRSGSCGRRPGAARTRAQSAGREPVSGAARDARHVRRLVVERPAERVADDEQARPVGPAACAETDRRLRARRSPARGARGAVIRAAPRGSGRRRRSARARRSPPGTRRDRPASRSSAAATSSGPSKPTPAVADELRVAAAAAVERREAAGERLEQRVRARVVEARGDVRVLPRRSVCELAPRPAERRASSPFEPCRRAADERQLERGRGRRSQPSAREHVRSLARVVRPARRDDAQRPAVERLALGAAGGRSPGSGAFGITTGSRELDPEPPVRLEAEPGLEHRRVRELGVHRGDPPVGAVVEAPVDADRPVDAVHHPHVVAREPPQAREVEVERVEEAATACRRRCGSRSTSSAATLELARRARAGTGCRRPTEAERTRGRSRRRRAPSARRAGRAPSRRESRRAGQPPGRARRRRAASCGGPSDRVTVDGSRARERLAADREEPLGVALDARGRLHRFRAPRARSPPPSRGRTSTRPTAAASAIGVARAARAGRSRRPGARPGPRGRACG